MGRLHGTWGLSPYERIQREDSRPPPANVCLPLWQFRQGITLGGAQELTGQHRWPVYASDYHLKPCVQELDLARKLLSLRAALNERPFGSLYLWDGVLEVW